MRRWRLGVAVLVGAALAVSGCGGGDDDATTRATTDSRDVDDFTRVVIDGDISTTITVGSDQSVEVVTDTDLAAQVTSTVSAGTLTVTTPAGFQPRTPSQLTITVPALDGVAVISSGATTSVNVEELAGGEFTAEVVGAATLRLGGEVEQLAVSVNQAGSVEAFSLAAQDVEVTTLSTSDVRLSALRTLTASIGSSGNVIYRGQPEITQSVTGTGQLIPDG